MIALILFMLLVLAISATLTKYIDHYIERAIEEDRQAQIDELTGRGKK